MCMYAEMTSVNLVLDHVCIVAVLNILLQVNCMSSWIKYLSLVLQLLIKILSREVSSGVSLSVVFVEMSVH